MNPNGNKFPTIHLIATPIGNLADLTARTIETLASCDIVLAEDTRQAQKLLSYLKLKKPTFRADDHTPLDKILNKIKLDEARVIALLTDAGTPGVSDPGSRLVDYAGKQGWRVIAAVGPSALTAFVSVAGFKETSFCFRGFFPKTSSDQKNEIELLNNYKLINQWVWFESGLRIRKTIELLKNSLVFKHRVIASKELSKIHEKTFFGQADEVLEQIKNEKGEWVLGIERSPDQMKSIPNEKWKYFLDQFLEKGLSSRDAAQLISQIFGVPKNEVYKIAIKKNEPPT